MDLFDLSAKLTLDASEYESGMQRSEGLGRRFAESISARTVAIGQVLGNFASKAIASVANLTKDLVQNSIKAYASYEQLVGGVETLFGAGGRSLEEYVKDVGNASDKTIAKYDSLMRAQEAVMKNAQQAYKTAGMSANEYMETATSFAASLVHSLLGNTENAAMYADMAVQDMADNANKMGTSIEAIQNAYQGFAKQNYTMLDNLKLGYGGTKTEMERLLNDAFKISGRKFNISSLADIYEAIHVIQQELGITGTTAKEAENTISGSINMLKASWENLMTAFGDPDADLDARIDELTYSLGKVAHNLFPVFTRTMGNMWDALKKAAGKLPGLVFGESEDGTVNWPTWSTVKGAALSAWEWIKEQAANLAGLVFGKNENGEVNWPTWSDVQAKASEAWEGIKAGALALGGLVFGTKADGSVDWPTWEDVEAKASEVWETIKSGVKGFAGLVFGNKSDGSVDWPTWSDVEASANTAWEAIKSNALKLSGLVFGTKSDGTVDWPTWDDVSSAATVAWDNIKATAKTLGGLVFGNKSDGSVDWPDWSDVESAATVAWDAIKLGATTLGGLVFGTKSDGTVDWPSWSDVESAATAAWDAIKLGASGLAGLVFGTKSDGTVDWPDWSTVSGKADEIWEGIKAGAKTLAGLVLGTKANGEVDWPDWDTVSGKAEEFWNGILEGAKQLGGIVFGTKEDGSINLPDANELGQKVNELITGAAGLIENLVFGITPDSSATEKIQTWWDGTVVPALNLVADFTLGMLGFDNFEDLSSAVYAWFRDKFSGLFEFLGIDTVQERDFSELQNIRSDRAGYEFAVGNNIGGVGYYQDIVGIVSEIDDLLSGSTADDLERFAQSMIDMANTKGGQGLFSQATLDALRQIEETGEFTPNEIQALAQAIQADLMNSITATANGIDGAKASVDAFSQSLNSLPRSIDVKVNLIPGENISGYSGFFDTGGQWDYDGSHAKGLWDVPYDDFAANLHRGEMVLTASQARRYRSGGGNGDIDYDVLAEKLAGAVMLGMNDVTVRSYISGRDVTDDVSRNQIRQLKARRFAL